MKLDEIDNNVSTNVVRLQKKEKTSSVSYSIGDNNSTILELLNPLKSININSNFHSFYNFKQMRSQVDKLIKAQSNIIFYVIHQNFMCDDEHKEFFKNMVGRFYDMPEWSWKYYNGYKYRIYKSYKTILHLVLLENFNLYKRYKYVKEVFGNITFNTNQDSTAFYDAICFSLLALEEYWGESNFKYDHTAYYVPFNKHKITDEDISDKRSWNGITFDEPYEFGRMQPTNFLIKRKSETLQDNYWFVASYDWIENSKEVADKFEWAILNYGVYASLGLENFDKIISAFKTRAEELNIAWKESWEEMWDEVDCKIIRSLSQTFPWSKEYIVENEQILNLDVLGLNMTVPWDMELVKFFIERGYGGRMSENKAVFDKVFEPILTDDILLKLFNCEYTPYE